MTTTPTIIFDHVTNTVTQVGSDPASKQKLAELIAASKADTTSGIPKRDS